MEISKKNIYRERQRDMQCYNVPCKMLSLDDKHASCSGFARIMQQPPVKANEPLPLKLSATVSLILRSPTTPKIRLFRKDKTINNIFHCEKTKIG
jgi:hypothetical protein